MADRHFFEIGGLGEAGIISISNDGSLIFPENANREIAAQNGLTIKGKGGILPEPTKPFDSGLLLVDGQVANPNLQTKNPSIKTIKTSIGNITPARGLIKTEDGQVILTAYRTDKLGTRTPNISASCS